MGVTGTVTEPGARGVVVHAGPSTAPPRHAPHIARTPPTASLTRASIPPTTHNRGHTPSPPRIINCFNCFIIN